MMAASQTLGADVRVVSLKSIRDLPFINLIDFPTVSGMILQLCYLSAHNATDTLQFIAAAHPENRDSQYWAAHNTYIDLTKLAHRQQNVVISQMIGADLDREEGTLTSPPLPPYTCTGGDRLPMANVDEVSESSSSAGMPSLGRGDGKLPAEVCVFPCNAIQECNVSVKEALGDKSSTIRTAQILSLERAHVMILLLKAQYEVSMLEKEMKLADLRHSAACAECNISNEDPRLTVPVPIIFQHSSSPSPPLSNNDITVDD